MAEKNNSNKIITILLAIVICVAAITILYVNLPQEETGDDETDDQDTTDETDEDETIERETILTVTYNEEETNYTLEELESMVTILGYGGYRTSLPMIKDQGIYMGIPVTAMVYEIAGNIENYSITVYDSKGENKTFNYTTIQGNVDIYNASNATNSTPISTGDVIMMICLQKDGEYLDEAIDGNLKIAFVNQDEEKITSSGLWWKYVISLEIIQD